MVSRNIKGPAARAAKPSDPAQLTLDLEPDFHEAWSCLRECIAQGIYRRGLSKVAPSLDEAPGNLSVQLSESAARHFSVDSLERYMEEFGDYQPIFYLASKFLHEKPVSPIEGLDDESIAVARAYMAAKRQGVRA